jgi:putative membrane protein
MIRHLLLATSALALASCASNMDYGNMSSPMAGRAGAPPMMGDMTPTMAMPYSMKAGASDLFEIQSSQIALQKSQNPNVRQFAQMLIAHHTQTTQTLMMQARAAGMTPPPPQLEPMQADMIRQLQAAPAGPGFDRLYITQQIPAHEMALALHQNYAARGDTPQLRTAAAGAVPLVQQHLTEAQRMSGMM